MVQVTVDVEQVKQALTALELDWAGTMNSHIRKGAKILQRAVKQDWSGRVMRLRTGTTAKTFRIRKGRERGNELSQVVISKWYIARFHESGYTMNPNLKTIKRFGRRVGTPLKVHIGGRWVTMKNRRAMPARNILRNQSIEQEPAMIEAIEGGLNELIVRAGLA